MDVTHDTCGAVCTMTMPHLRWQQALLQRTFKKGRIDEARALTVRLAARPQWADALRLPVESEALRPPALEVLPRLALR